MRLHYTTVAAVLISVAFLAAGAAFTVNDSLASFADDSISYVVMAQYFSPFHPASAAIAHAYAGETNYPPVFALLLAVLDGAHNLAAAHLIVVACLAAALLVGYAWFYQNTGSPLLAVGMVALFVSMPVVWMNIQGILSEALYLLIVLTFMVAYERWQPVAGATLGRLAALGALLALAVLTRNVAITLIGAYGVTVWLGSDAGVRWRLRSYLPALIAVGGVVLWLSMRPSGVSGLYTDIIAGILGNTGNQQAAGNAPGSLVLPQLAAMYPAWASSFLMYWTDAWTARDVIVLCLAILTVLGLATRLAANRIDAWYVLLYLVTVLVWPTSLQMQRFLFPIMPLLLLHLVDAVRFLGARVPVVDRNTLAGATLVITMIAVTFPALAFFYFRFSEDSNTPYRYVAEYYRVPDLPGARDKAGAHARLFEDMRTIRQSTTPDSVVMWYMPGYLALLADRKSVGMPPVDTPGNFYRYLMQYDIDYVFLSRLHPRETLDHEVLNRWLGYFDGFTSPVWSRVTGNSEPESVLLRVNPRELERLYGMAVEPPAGE